MYIVCLNQGAESIDKNIRTIAANIIIQEKENKLRQNDRENKENTTQVTAQCIVTRGFKAMDLNNRASSRFIDIFNLNSLAWGYQELRFTYFFGRHAARNFLRGGTTTVKNIFAKWKFRSLYLPPNIFLRRRNSPLPAPPPPLATLRFFGDVSYSKYTKGTKDW
jgi:hypothetical protein